MSEIDPRPFVAETLRTVAGWLADDGERRMLYDTAQEIELMERDDACCALCEEVTCDGHCPMAIWRRG